MTSEISSPASLGSRWQYGRLVPMPEAVPAGWDFVRLTEVARLESGHTPSRKHPEYWLGNIPWVSLHDTKVLDRAMITQTAQTIGELGLANSSARLLPAGTVVFSRTATVGKATILGREMATSQDFANYVCGPKVHNAYLLHLFRFLRPEWNRLMAGSTHNTVYMPVFENLQVLLPPLGEQRKIAAILSSVDDAIEATQAVIDQLKIVKNAMMTEVLTRGLPGRHTRFKQTGIGEVPEGWRVLPIRDVVESCDYGLSTSLTLDARGVAVLRMGNLKDGFVSLEDLKFASMSEVDDRLMLAAGDVLFNRTNSAALVGKVGVFRGAEYPVSFASYLLRLRVRPAEADGFWLSAVMNTETNQQRIRSLATPGVSQVNVNRSKMLALEVPVPPLDEQRELMAVLLAVNTRLENEARFVSGLVALKASLMSVLLTGEVRVTPDEAAA